VPQEIVNSVSDVEKRRQEAINEVIYTERDFVRDMEYLRDVHPLSNTEPFLHLTNSYPIGMDQRAERRRHYTPTTTYRLPGTSLLEHTRHHSSEHTTPGRA
jgi:hypothetical protein